MSTGITWPTNLPKPLLGSVNMTLADNVMRTRSDSGAYKTFRLSSKNIWLVRFSLLLDKQQWDDFITFYTNTLKHGALPFDWQHFDTGVPVRCFFTAPPTRMDMDSQDHVRVEVQLRMEE